MTDIWDGDDCGNCRYPKLSCPKTECKWANGVSVPTQSTTITDTDDWRLRDRMGSIKVVGTEEECRAFTPLEEGDYLERKYTLEGWEWKPQLWAKRNKT